MLLDWMVRGNRTCGPPHSPVWFSPKIQNLSLIYQLTFGLLEAGGRKPEALTLQVALGGSVQGAFYGDHRAWENEVGRSTLLDLPNHLFFLFL